MSTPGDPAFFTAHPDDLAMGGPAAALAGAGAVGPLGPVTWPYVADEVSRGNGGEGAAAPDSRDGAEGDPDEVVTAGDDPRLLERVVETEPAVPAVTDELIAAAKRGERDAWEQLYFLHARELHGFLMTRLSDADDAAEALSETFLRALEKITGLRGGATSIRAWLFTIARNVSTDRLRMRKRLWLQSESAESPDPATGDLDDGLIATQDRGALHLALDRLEPDDREVLWLRVGLGLSSQEVAQIVGKKPGAVRMQQLRALRALTEVFDS